MVNVNLIYSPCPDGSLQTKYILNAYSSIHCKNKNICM